MHPMTTGACGKATLSLKERKVLLPPGSEMTNVKAPLPIYPQSQSPKVAVVFVFSRRCLHSLLSPWFFPLLPVSFYAVAGGRNDRERLLSLSPALSSMQYTKPFCFGLLQKQDLLEPLCLQWSLAIAGNRLHILY